MATVKHLEFFFRDTIASRNCQTDAVLLQIYIDLSIYKLYIDLSIYKLYIDLWIYFNYSTLLIIIMFTSAKDLYPLASLWLHTTCILIKF